MSELDTIGIIGGMGPEATNRLCQLITALTPATCDQGHIPVITFNNSAIPSRVDAIFAGAASPLPELIRTARVLQAAGADFLVMPCNTAHYYFDDIQNAVDIPILNMIEETVRFIANEYLNIEAVGILGSTPTLDCGLFHKYLAQQQMRGITPQSAVQADLVMSSIFGEDGIKAGYQDQPKLSLVAAGRHLIQLGAQGVIAGCTEVSLVLNDGDLDVPLFDPLRIIAELSVKRSMIGKLKSDKKKNCTVSA